MNILTTIKRRITAISKSEKVTKEQLGLISRELLNYVLVDTEEHAATGDIQPVNKLLSVLTPMNKQTAVLYFSAMLPFAFNKDECKFGLMQKKKRDNAIINAKEFLEVEDNNIWTWAANNVKVEAKPIDWHNKIKRDITKALEAEENALTPKEVLMAVLSGGITAQDVGDLMELLAQGEEQEAKAA